MGRVGVPRRQAGEPKRAPEAISLLGVAAETDHCESSAGSGGGFPHQRASHPVAAKWRRHVEAAHPADGEIPRERVLIEAANPQQLASVARQVEGLARLL